MRTATRTKRTVTPRGTKRVVKLDTKRTPSRNQRRRRNLIKLAAVRKAADRQREAA
jgi:hypothetical protein